MSYIYYLLAVIMVYLGGKLVQKVNLPAILGWLLVGIIVGPYVTNILSQEIINQEWYQVLMIFVQVFVGMMLGKNIDFNRMKKSGKQMITLSLSEIFITFIVVSIAFGILFTIRGFPLILALVIGAVATATAPAPPISVTKEYDTEGPVTRTVISLTIFNAVFVTTLFFTGSAILQSTLLETSTSIITQLLTMLIIPIIYGAVMGMITAKVLKDDYPPQRNLLLYIIAIVLTICIAIFIDQTLYKEPAMMFLMMGIAFKTSFVNSMDDNIKTDLSKVEGRLHEIALLLLIINLCAPLNPNALINAGVGAVLYTLIRMLGKWLGGYIPGKIMNLDQNVSKYIGITMFSHAGQGLVFAGVGAKIVSFLNPAYGDYIMTIIPAAAIITEIIGILLSKKVYEWSGEMEVEYDHDEQETFIDEHSIYRYYDRYEKYFDK
ncbi:cation:proton antiporter [Facklamia sp. DSM 111018]|uniref:Cation:proton antiporter n=1 Tax=Facklamia lactis TaxID=2749967 RepID=A0ABS0LMP7_9LACT|nr:cation:proton antiporter [Facklamia lactis]MBG9979897.1 cation:proton antiporter [Facklamia lactis]MBG9985423.1 cation:proton antiporter [Facklamia lactis]